MKEQKKNKNKRMELFSNRYPNIFWHGSMLYVEGFNQLRLLNELRNAGVKIFQLNRISSSKMTFVVKLKDIKKTIAILEKLSYNYSVVKDISPFNIGKFLLQKLALCLATVLFISLSVYAYGFVWRLEINGYEKLESAYIRNILSENGFRAGTRKSRLDLTTIRAVLNELDDVLESTVEIRGTTLSVNIIETLDYEPFPIENRTGIFSKFDAEVTRIVAHSGTPLVDIGSRVFRGGMLIAPHRIDAQGLPVLVPSIGRVYGVATFSNSVRFRLVDSDWIQTGNVQKRTRISIFGLRVGGRRAVSFESYDAVTNENYAFNNWFLPLRVAQTRNYETIWQEETFTLEERVQYHIDNHIAINAIFVGDSPYTVTHILEDLGNGEYLIHIFLQAELLIGSSQ